MMRENMVPQLSWRVWISLEANILWRLAEREQNKCHSFVFVKKTTDSASRQWRPLIGALYLVDRRGVCRGLWFPRWRCPGRPRTSSSRWDTSTARAVSDPDRHTEACICPMSFLWTLPPAGTWSGSELRESKGRQCWNINVTGSCKCNRQSRMGEKKL